MTEIKAVKEPTPDPKAGKPKPKSGISVPYYDLAQSIEAAKAIHEKGGGACSREQLAPILGYSGTNNGGFLTRVSAAKMFGLLEESGETLRLTQRAKTVLHPIMPQDAERGKIEAFLSVELFSKFYERFKGAALPQEVGIKNLLENTYAIVPGRVVPSLRVMMDSAEQAGFFQATGNRSRMVMPMAGNAAQPAETAPPASDEIVERVEQRRTGGSGGNGGNDGGKGNGGIPSALTGLLEKLPPHGTPLSAKRRKSLVDAFKAAIDFLYQSDDEAEEQP